MTAKPERRRERAALAADLPRLAGVVEDQPRGRRPRAAAVLQDAQALFLRHARLHAAEDPDRVPLLEPVAACAAPCSVSMCVKDETGTSSPVGRLDLEVEQRPDRRPLGVADLRDHLVAAIEEVEAVHVRAAEQRAQLLPTPARSSPRSATRSRSMTTRASGRSILRSVST